MNICMQVSVWMCFQLFLINPCGWNCWIIQYLCALVAQMLNYLLAIQETWVRSLSWEEPLM